MLRALFVAAATVTIILIEISYWDDAPKAVALASVAVLGVAAGAPALANAAGREKDRRDRRAEEQAMNAFRVALKVVVERSGVGFERVGFNCLLVPPLYRKVMTRRVRHRLFGWLSEPVRRRLGRRPRLRSIVKFRIIEGPPTSGIRWNRQKGIIGECWAQRDTVGLDVRTKYLPYLAMTRDEWDRGTPESIKLGLSHGEWRLVADKYNVVIVAPILVRGEFWGCVTLDTPYNEDRPDEHADDYRQLWSSGVQSALRDAAIYIGNWME